MLSGIGGHVVGESSFWVLIKEIFLNRGKLSLDQAIYIDSEQSHKLNDDIKIFEWARENLKGRWHIRLYGGELAYTNMFTNSAAPMVTIAKFNREEDAMAFKLRWL